MSPDPGVYNSITAAFCVANYYTQSLMLTVNASNHAVVRPVNAAEEGRTLLPGNIFNTTQLEYVIGAWISAAGSQTQRAQILTHGKFVHIQHPRSQQQAISKPLVVPS